MAERSDGKIAVVVVDVVHRLRLARRPGGRARACGRGDARGGAAARRLSAGDRFDHRDRQATRRTSRRRRRSWKRRAASSCRPTTRRARWRPRLSSGSTRGGRGRRVMAEQSRVAPVAALFNGPAQGGQSRPRRRSPRTSRAVGAEVVQVDWRPPAGGDAVALDALDRIASGANRRRCGQQEGGRHPARRQADADRHRRRRRGHPRHDADHHSPRRTAGDLGADVRPDAGRRDRRPDLRGSGEGPRRGRGARRLRPHHVRALPPPRRRRPDGRHRHGEDAGVDLRERRLRQPRLLPRSTRVSARCCATARSPTRCSTGCAGSRRTSRPS